MTDDLKRVAETLGFFASVIKSGEPWTDVCQQHYDASKDAIAALASDTRGEGLEFPIDGPP